MDSKKIFANLNKGSDFVDWAPGLFEDSFETRRGTHFALTKAFDDASFLLGELGDLSLAQYYGDLAKTLRFVGRNYFLDSKSQTFGSRRQINAMAILSGTALEADGQIILKNSQSLQCLLKEIATPYYNYYVLDAMAQVHQYESALNVIRNLWGGMLELGATTFWEAYDPKWPKENFHSHLKADDGEGTFVSLSHGWASGPTAWLTENVLGIKSKSGGFKTVEINPHIEDLQWASGSVPTPHGLIKIKLIRENNFVLGNLTLPPDITAQIYGQPLEFKGSGDFQFRLK